MSETSAVTAMLAALVGGDVVGGHFAAGTRLDIRGSALGPALQRSGSMSSTAWG